MKPIDFRNETFDMLHQRLTSLRRQAYHHWIEHGPGTTREVAQRCGMDLLTFRPRTTELFQIGLVVVDESASARPQGDGTPAEGIYKARTLEEWQAWYQKEREAAVSGQQQLI